MILKLKIGRWFENWMLILKNDSKQFSFFFFPQTLNKNPKTGRVLYLAVSSSSGFGNNTLFIAFQ